MSLKNKVIITRVQETGHSETQEKYFTGTDMAL